VYFELATPYPVKTGVYTSVTVINFSAVWLIGRSYKGHAKKFADGVTFKPVLSGLSQFVITIYGKYFREI